MIASPCKNCPKENLPKVDCAKDCKLLQAVQNFKIQDRDSDISSRQDYFIEIGYDIPQSFEIIAALL
jgi:hypothetical protein